VFLPEKVRFWWVDPEGANLTAQRSFRAVVLHISLDPGNRVLKLVIRLGRSRFSVVALRRFLDPGNRVLKYQPCAGEREVLLTGVP
jgi:hypothetical protein